ncbi:cytochrome c [Pleurocapsales cyanobacterium LEGE 06147]|nr:cytochrome c [Pleurocapsales cyanobacterium LEGE 06147]
MPILEAIIKNNALFPDQELVHVNALIALAQHLDEIFPPGTAMDEEGWGAKPLIWQEPENFAKIIHDFECSLESLQTVMSNQASATDTSEALSQVRQQCLACHQTYRVRQS